MASSSLIKSLENIMRIDDGVDGDSQYIAQITWMLLLNAFDAKEMEWEFKPDYKGIVPVGYRWRDWADDKEGITGDALIKFVGELFEKLRKLDVSDGDMRKYIVRNVFEDINNYMKSGIQLRKLINAINEKVDFNDAREKHTFNELSYNGYYELFLLEFATGMRRGEICGLKWDDLNFETGELKIQRQVVATNDGVLVKKPKTKDSVRTIMLDASLLKVLWEHKEKSDSQWIFPSPVAEDSPLNPHTVYRKTQQILERAGCKKVRFHDLRHTFATMSLENGMDIKTLSNMIGHASVATTLDIYSHITDEMLKNAARTIDRGIGKANSRPENEIEIVMKKEVAPPPRVDFEAYKGKIRKSGTGGIYKINENLYEGRYTPTNAYGKRESCNVYAKTYEECEEKLEEMIAMKRAEIAAEKARLKAQATA